MTDEILHFILAQAGIIDAFAPNRRTTTSSYMRTAQS